MVQLSILICSLPSRIHDFQVIDQLTQQSQGRPVEILYLGDNWRMTIGEKRNALKSLAAGDYLAFVDDDDSVAESYIDDLLSGAASAADVLTFKAQVDYPEPSTDGQDNRTPVSYSLEFEQDRNLFVVGTADIHEFQRLPNHICCWKAELIKPVDFPPTIWARISRGPR